MKDEVKAKLASRSISIAVSVIDCRRLRSLEAWLSLNSLDINARYQQ